MFGYLQKALNDNSTCLNSILTSSNIAHMSGPRYPRKYPNNANCSWSLAIPAESSVWLSCETFSLERGDTLAVNGTEHQGAVSPGAWVMVPLTNTAAYTLDITFTSNRRRSSRGFLCWVNVESNSTGYWELFIDWIFASFNLDTLSNQNTE